MEEFLAIPMFGTVDITSITGCPDRYHGRFAQILFLYDDILHRFSPETLLAQAPNRFSLTDINVRMQDCKSPRANYMGVAIGWK